MSIYIYLYIYLSIYLPIYVSVYLVNLVEDLVVLYAELDILVMSHPPAHTLEDVQVRRHGEVPIQHDVEHWNKNVIYLSIHLSIYLSI